MNSAHTEMLPLPVASVGCPLITEMLVKSCSYVCEMKCVIVQECCEHFEDTKFDIVSDVTSLAMYLTLSGYYIGIGYNVIVVMVRYLHS